MATVKEARMKTAKSPLASKSSAAAMGEAAAKEKPKRLPGIQKLIPVFPVMKEFLGGVTEITRVDAIKRIWEHIKLNGLQNSANKREFFCDEKLKGLFEGREKMQMLEVSKLLVLHFVKSGHVYTHLCSCR